MIYGQGIGGLITKDFLSIKMFEQWQNRSPVCGLASTLSDVDSTPKSLVALLQDGNLEIRRGIRCCTEAVRSCTYLVIKRLSGYCFHTVVRNGRRLSRAGVYLSLVVLR